MALYFVLWGKGLKSCGPVRAIMAEYAGAWLGVLSAVLYGRRRQLWKKVGGFVAIALSFYFFSAGWATATHSPFSFGDNSGSDASSQRADAIGIKEMLVPVFAGILSALRRVVARRVSLKNQLKRRLHAITITSATCFLFPFTIWETALGSASDGSSKSWFLSWAYISTVLFGIVLIFYIDNMAEERLHMVVSSPRHLMISGGSIIVMAIAYGMDFSLLGFLVCCSVLAVGIHQATSFERLKKGEDDPVDFVDDSLSSQTTSPLPS